MVGCSSLMCCAPNPKTVWSITATSPDGQWIAGARTQGWSGPGIGTVESSVYLERTQGSRQAREPQDVVSYPEGQGNARPQIKWLSTTELVVSIPAQAQAHLDLQVVKFADVQIKVHVLPSGVSSSGSRAPTDPLGLYGPGNKDLSDCLNKANPGDPAGLRGETQAQAAARKACIDKYAH